VRAGLLVLSAAALAGCAPERETAVDPYRYDAYFLWAGVEPPPVLGRARTIYILAGEVRAGGAARLVPLRPGTPSVRHAEVWLTVRVERLDWNEPVHDAVLRQLARWEEGGARLSGLQIDFDARTRGLDGYAASLAEVRERLPSRWRLSVTGLMDWSAQGDPAALAQLAGTVDEIVIQTYQGRRTIPGYERYMASLARLPLPYKVALVEGGEWREPAVLRRDPEFKGYVVFLVPR
jgi:hypothetical protein